MQGRQPVLPVVQARADHSEVVQVMAIEAETTTDGRTVWVHGADGACIGRFSPFGNDVHSNLSGQMDGRTCLDCTKAPDWKRFVREMRRRHGVRVPKSMRPSWVKKESASDVA